MESRLYSNDILIKLNDIDLYGVKVNELKYIVNSLQDDIVVTLLRPKTIEESNIYSINVETNIDDVSYHNEKDDNELDDILDLSGSFEQEIMSRRSNEENKNIILTWYPNHNIFHTKLKSNIGSLRKIRSKFVRKKKSKRIINYLKKSKPKESIDDTVDNKISVLYNENHKNSLTAIEMFIDQIKRKYVSKNINWEIISDKGVLWNGEVTEFIGLFGLGFQCKCYEGFPIVNNINNISAVGISGKVKMEDVVISLNGTLLVDKSELEINELLITAPRGLNKIRIIRRIKINSFSANLSQEIEKEKFFNFSTLSPKEGAFLTIKLEKCDVIGFFIDGGNGKPISIRRMYSGVSGSKMGTLLRCSDIIISVNDVSFENMSYSDAFIYLKNIPSGEMNIEIFRKFENCKQWLK